MKPGFLGAVAASAVLGAALAGGVASPAAFAHGVGHGHTQSRIKIHVHDQTAVRLAHALRASLRSGGVAIVSMRKAVRGRSEGYLVTWASKGREGRLFVNARTGHVARVGHPVRLSGGTSGQTATVGVSLSAFLTALETVLASEAGAPVTAQTTNNGSTIVFTLTINSQTVTVTVNIGTPTTGTTSGSSGTGSGNAGTTTIAAPAVSMQAAIAAALNALPALNNPALTGAFAVSASLQNFGGYQGGDGQSSWGQGVGSQSGAGQSGDGQSLPNAADSGDSGNGGNGSQGQISGAFSPTATPSYDIVLESASGMEADVVVSAMIAAGATAPTAVVEQLSQQQPASAPATTLAAAIQAALTTDSGGIPVQAQLDNQSNSPVWVVELLNADGSTGQVVVDATSGQVTASPFVGGQGDQGSQDSQGSQGGQDN